jgi:O6-methylguanine-DNA--protein-cysteine methyltransferase
MSPTITLPANPTKEERRKAIDEAARIAKEKRAQEAEKAKDAAAAQGDRAAVAAIDTKSKKSKKKDKEADDTKAIDDATKKRAKVKEEAKAHEAGDMLTVSDIARELGIDPKVARAKLRRTGASATEGRWAKIKRDSKEHKDLIKLIKPE